MDTPEREKTQATLKLLAALAEGERFGKEEGWLSLEEVEADLGI